MGVCYCRVSVNCLDQIMQFSTYMVMKPFNKELCGVPDYCPVNYKSELVQSA